MCVDVALDEGGLVSPRFAHHCALDMDVTLFDGGCFGGI